MICDDESVGLDRMTTMYLTHCRWLILTLVAPEVGVEAFDLVKKFIDSKSNSYSTRTHLMTSS